MSLVSYSPTKSFVLGIGSYVPEKVLGNKELSQKVETSDEWIRTRTGISERRIARSDQATSDLALEAAKAGVRAIKFADGGIVPGTGDTDSVPAMLTPGEVILNAAQQENLVGGMGSSITVNIQGGIVDESYVSNELIPAINKATSLGTKLNA